MAKQRIKIPIIAAGGIGDSRGLLGALAMGADAICLGTAIMTCQECPAPLESKKKWISTDIFSEDFYKKIYHYNVKYFASPSTAIAHQKQILPLKTVIANIMTGAEEILKSWGFNTNIFDSTSI
jgi:nitronate monooxygenase